MVVRKMSDGVRELSECVRKVSDGVRRSRMVPGRFQVISNCDGKCRMVSGRYLMMSGRCQLVSGKRLMGARNRLQKSS